MMKKIHLVLIPVLVLLLSILVPPLAGRKTETPPEKENKVSELWIVTDIHFLSKKLRDKGSRFSRFIETGGGMNILRIDEILAGFLSALEESPPAALLVTGDLTFNGEKLSHKELAGWFGKIESLGTEVYVIPGNHDIQNPWARRITEHGVSRTPTISAGEFSSIYKDFGFQNALSHDSGSLSYLIEPVPGLQILMLDTCMYEENLNYGIPVSNGRISSDTKSWIKEFISVARQDGKSVAAAMHHTLLEHNPMVSKGFTVDDNRSLIDFFSELNIRSFLTGHIHIQDIIEETSNGKRILDISTNALSVYPHNYGTLRKKKGEWIYKAESLSSRPELFEEDLPEFLRTFFIKSSDSIARKSLDKDLYSRDEIDEMSGFLAQANINFFSGNEKPEDYDPGSIELFQLDDKSFLSSYLNSILNDSPPGDKSVKLVF